MRKILFVLYIALVLTGCNKKARETVIANYTTGTVTLDELADRYSRLSANEQKKMKTKDDIFKLVRQIALEKIIIQEAKKQGLDKKTEYVEQIDKIQRETGYEILQQKNVIKKVNISEADYTEYTKLYELYQIVKRTDILGDAEKKRARAQLEKLSKSIENLDDFKKAAAEHSDDMTKNRGGLVGSIRAGVMEDEINLAMKKLKPGTVSQVIETYVGYHIIFVAAVQKVEMDTLLEDKELYEIIRNRKIETIELAWYDKLLASKDVSINYDLIKKKVKDQSEVVSYKDQKITREDVLNRVDELRADGAFPEPTFEELKNLVRTMALNMIIEYEIKAPEVTDSKKFKEQIDAESKYLLINSFIRENIKPLPVSEDEIRQFYEENLQTLFTFKTKEGIKVVQDMSEVTSFITQKLQSGKVQQARYTLYKKLVSDHNLNIIDSYLEDFLANKDK